MRSADSASHLVRPLPRVALQLATAAGLTLAGAALSVVLSTNAAADEADSAGVPGDPAPAISAPVTPSTLDVPNVDAVSTAAQDAATETTSASTDSASESVTETATNGATEAADTARETATNTAESNAVESPASGRPGSNDDGEITAQPTFPRPVPEAQPTPATGNPPEDSTPLAESSGDPIDAALPATPTTEPVAPEPPIVGALGHLGKRALNGLRATVDGVVPPIEHAVEAGQYPRVPLPNLDALIPGQRPAPSDEPTVTPAPAEPSPAPQPPTMVPAAPSPDPGARASEPAPTPSAAGFRSGAETPPHSPLTTGTARSESTAGAEPSLAAAHAQALPAQLPTDRGSPLTPAAPAGSIGAVAHDHTTSNRHQLGVLPVAAHPAPLRLIGTTRTAASDDAGTDTARPTTSPD